jgi:hypothetical protein
MDPRRYYNKREIEVLERAFKIVISLKVTQHNNPLNVVMLDELEDHLKELRFLKIELEKNSLLDEISIQEILEMKLLKLMRCIVKLFNIPLSCIQYLKIQILYI